MTFHVIYLVGISRFLAVLFCDTPQGIKVRRPWRLLYHVALLWKFLMVKWMNLSL